MRPKKRKQLARELANELANRDAANREVQQGLPKLPTGVEHLSGCEGDRMNADNAWKHRCPACMYRFGHHEATIHAPHAALRVGTAYHVAMMCGASIEEARRKAVRVLD